MKTILFMAMSVNGMIARKNGEEDFLSEKNWDIFSALAKECSCFVIGRKTYEDVLKFENYDFSDLEGVKKILLSQKSDFDAKGFEIAGSPKEAIEKATRDGMKKLLIAGGATINSAFAKEKLIDEIILVVEPVIIGEGISLFRPDNFDLKLKYVSTEELEDGRIKISYNVIK